MLLCYKICLLKYVKMTQYDRWINGNDCCCNNSHSTINPDCDRNCSCEAIYLEIDNMHTDINVISGEVENKLDASAYTPVSLDGYATEQWVEDKGYLTEVDLSDYALIEDIPTEVSELNNDAGYINQLKTINGESLIGEGNIQIGEGGTIDAYTKEEADNRFALKSELSGYVETSTLIQYISNLQEQITSIINSISGCCGETGETQYRWITMTGENDYWCDGTNKYTKEKQQSSTDGIVWTDTGNYRKGVLIETDSTDCGYVPVISNKLTVNYINGDEISKECDGSTVLRNQNFSNWENISGATVGDCITEIDDFAFYGFSGLTSISLPNTINRIGKLAFNHCLALPSISIPSGVTEIGKQAFGYCWSLNNVTIPNGVENLYYATFYYCSGLTSITLSNSLKKIDNDAVKKCGLTGLTIPSTVTSIGKHAFAFNSALSSVTCLATTPPSFHDSGETGTGGNSGDIFYACPLTSIKVPSASVNAYKTAWPLYASIIEGI